MQTQRQMLKELLLEGEFSSLELSQRLSLPEKEVLDHLAHIALAPGPGCRFRTKPAVCKNCGFAFKKRERLSTSPAALSATGNLSVGRASLWCADKAGVRG